MSYTTEREYWEFGCLCILTGRTPICGSNMADDVASEYYSRACQCSRADTTDNFDADLEAVMREELRNK